MKTDETGSASGIPNNLPPRPSPFVNREEEIQQAISALLDSSVCAVALVGIAGIGKTSIAVEIAYRLLGKGEFTGGIIWLAARDLQSSADLTGKIAAVLGVSGSEVTPRLSSRRCLVVLDGLDELNPPHALEVKHFLETFPAPSKALVTSRKESVLPSQAATIRVDTFSEKSAIELFNALGASKDTEVPYVERGRIAEIIRALGYHPLAVTLAVRLIQGRYAEAREGSQQLLGILDELVHESNRVAILGTIAQIYFTLGDLDGAIQLYQQSLITQEKLGNVHGMAQTFDNLGVMYVQKGEWDKAIEFYQRSLAIKEQLGDVRGLAQTYNNLGLVYADKGEWDKAIEFYQSSLATMEQLGDLHGMAQTYNNLGLVYADKGEWDKAIEFYQKALAIMERVGDSRGKSAALHNMAQIFVARGDLDRAMQLYQQSLALKEQIGDLQGKSATLHQMAGIFVARGDLDRAMQLYQESLGTYERIGDLYSFALTLNNLGMMYRAKGDLETAYENISRSHEILGKLGVPQANSVLSVQAEIGYELGKLLVDQGRWYDALRLFEESLAIRRQGDDLNARADPIYQIARVHHLMGNLDKARIHYRDALRLYQHTQNLQGVAACETGLGRLMIQMGFLDDAVRELDSAKQIYHQLGDDRRIAEVEEVLRVANHIKGRQST